MTDPKLRVGLQAALQQLAHGDLRRNAFTVLAALGYSHHAPPGSQYGLALARVRPCTGKRTGSRPRCF
ncbi:MAG: hypothetical protein Q7U58_16140, partial [Hydrogenophaga sp.]|nr:hypothetical protein [Hydrogenophaga sp.]